MLQALTLTPPLSLREREKFSEGARKGNEQATCNSIGEPGDGAADADGGGAAAPAAGGRRPRGADGVGVRGFSLGCGGFAASAGEGGVGDSESAGRLSAGGEAA